MQNLKKTALVMCLMACIGFGFTEKTYAEEVMPSSGVAYEDLDREISNLEFAYSHNKNSWASVTDLSLLYYDRGDYKNCYKMSKRALKLYKDGYAYENDEDILRESLVKGAAAAYNLGEYRNAEKMLKDMIGLSLRGSDDNAKTYMGWAYYYLSNIERIRGNYDRSHFYGGICINYCPHHHIFLDYWNCFYYTGTFWHWRHHHHDYRPPMPPPRPHWRDHHGPRHDHHQPKHEIKRPVPQRHSVHQQPRSTAQRPQRQAPVYQSRTQSQNPRPAVNRPQEHRPAVHQQSRPTAQRPQGQAPVYQPRTQTQNSRPAVNRPQEHRPVVHQQSGQQAQNSRPAVNRPQEHRPVVHQQSRPTAQRTQKQAPVYQTKEQSQEQMPVYQPKQSAQRPAPQRQATRQYHAPQSNHRRR